MLLRNFLSNIKFITQVLFLTLIMNMFICGVFIIILEVGFKLNQEYIIPSHLIIFNRETSRQLKYYSNMYQYQVKRQITQQFHTLDSVVGLYHYIQETSHTIIPGPQQCLLSQYLDTYNYLSEVCYYSKADSSEDEHFNDTIDLVPVLTQFIYTFDFDNLDSIFYLSAIPGSLAFEYPYVNEDDTPIYTDQFFKEQPRNFIGPSLPNEYLPIVIIAFRDLINTDLTYQGIISLFFKFNQFRNFENIYYYLIDPLGYLSINTQSFSYQNQPYIYNQSLTGFNYIDWAQISSSGNIVLYNTLLDMEVEVLNLWFPKYQISLLVFKNTKPDIIEMKSLMTQFDESNTYLILINSVFFCLLVVLVIITQFWIIKGLLEPIIQIIILLQKSYLKQSESQFKAFYQLTFTRLQHKNLGQFRKLTKSLKKLLNKSKSKQCVQIEKFIYPRSTIDHDQVITLQYILHPLFQDF